MIVRRVYDMADIIKIVPIEIELQKKHKVKTDVKECLTFIQSMLHNPTFGIWMAFEDETEAEVIGYVCAIASPFRMRTLDGLQIWRIWTGKKGVSNLFWNIIKDFCKQQKLSFVRIEVNNHVKACQRKFKFTPIGVTMERRI